MRVLSVPSGLTEGCRRPPGRSRGRARLRPGRSGPSTGARSATSASSTETPCCRRTTSRGCWSGSRPIRASGVAGGALTERSEGGWKVVPTPTRPRHRPCPHLSPRVLREDRRRSRSARLRSDHRDLRPHERLQGPHLRRPAGAPPAADGEQAGDSPRPRPARSHALHRRLRVPLGRAEVADAGCALATAGARGRRLPLRLSPRRTRPDRAGRGRGPSGHSSGASSDGACSRSARPPPVTQRRASRGRQRPARRSGIAGTNDERARRQIVEVLRTLEAYGDRNGWVGSDPYDGLNATRLVTPLQAHLSRQAADHPGGQALAARPAAAARNRAGASTRRRSPG